MLLRRVRDDVAATSSGRLRLSADRRSAALATDRPLIPTGSSPNGWIVPRRPSVRSIRIRFYRTPRFRPMPLSSARKPERARRYAFATTDKKIIDRLNEIAALYDELAAGQDPGLTDRD